MTPNDDDFTNTTISRSPPTSRYYSGADLTTTNSYSNNYNTNNANNATINITSNNSSTSLSSSITPNYLTNNAHNYNKYNRKPRQTRPEEVIEMNEISVKNGHANIDTLEEFFEEVN